MTSFLTSITKRKKTPEQLVASACTSLEIISNGPSSGDSSSDENLCKRLGQMKTILYGDGKAADIDEEKVIELATKIISENLLLKLILQLEMLPFEARKDTAHIFNNMMRKNICNFPQYVLQHYEIIEKLILGYANAETALNCGTMLRECIRFDDIAGAILHSSLLWQFFDSYVHLKNFEIAADSFATLKAILTTSQNQGIAGEFLESHYDEVMGHYEKLLQSDNFVTRWMSLKLLGEILLDRRNRNIMVRYVSSVSNLKSIMNLLRDRASNIQFEAFHVFKAFVANPNKPHDISTILFKNRTKLISFLEGFQSDRDDSQFAEEKSMLIDMLSALSPPMDLRCSSNSGKEFANVPCSSSSSNSSSSSRNAASESLLQTPSPSSTGDVFSDADSNSRPTSVIVESTASIIGGFDNSATPATISMSMTSHVAELRLDESKTNLKYPVA